jgi:hypothetical protein
MIDLKGKLANPGVAQKFAAAFVELIDDLVDPATKKAFKQKLVKDK